MKPLHYRLFLLLLFLSVGLRGSAQDFFDVHTYTCQRATAKGSFEAKVDFPVMGPAAMVSQLRQWICEVLEVNAPKKIAEHEFPKLLDESASDYLEDNTGKRDVLITWVYEDPDCVSFQCKITDKDSVTWISEDCATFSKRDGHQIQPDEVFNCSEKQIKELMWKFRGDLPMEVGSADQLYVGDVAFIDGWILVVGPAAHHTGAVYKIRYQEAEPYLRHSSAGYLSE